MPPTRQGQANLRRAGSRDPDFRSEISFVMTNKSPWLMKYSQNQIITFGGWRRLVTSLQDIKAKPIFRADTVHLEFRSEISDRASVCHLLALCSHTHTQDKVDWPVGKSPRKTLPLPPVWIPPLKLKSLCHYPLESVGVTAQLFSHEPQFFFLHYNTMFCSWLTDVDPMHTFISINEPSICPIRYIWPSSSLAIFCGQH